MDTNIPELFAQAKVEPVALSNGFVETGAMEILKRDNPRMAARVKLHEQFSSDFMGMLTLLPVVRNIVSWFVKIPGEADFLNIRTTLEQPEKIAGTLGQFVGKKQAFTLSFTEKDNDRKLKGIKYEVEGKTYIQYGDRWLYFRYPVAIDEIPLKYLLNTELQVGNPALRKFLGVEKLSAAIATKALPAGA